MQAGLKRAVWSIQNQTCRSYEIILVDASSTDGSAEICDQLAEDDVRIRVIHQENNGAASARNAALDVARGDFLFFMDGNDWCEPDMLSDMHRAAVDNELDVLITGFTIDTYYDKDGSFLRELRNAPNRIYESQEEFRADACHLFDARLLIAPWNMLFRRSYVQENELHFTSALWNDIAFSLHAMRDVVHIGCLDGNYYHFVRLLNDTRYSAYHAEVYNQREEEHRQLTELYRYWGIDSAEVEDFLARRYAEQLISCVENITSSDCSLSKEEKLDAIRTMISTPHARDALSKARPHSRLMGLALTPLRMGNVALTATEVSFISWVKKNNAGLFTRLRANR